MVRSALSIASQGVEGIILSLLLVNLISAHTRAPSGPGLQQISGLVDDCMLRAEDLRQCAAVTYRLFDRCTFGATHARTEPRVRAMYLLDLIKHDTA